MAHIPEGILSEPVLIGGAILGIAMLGYSLKRMPPESIPQTALLAAALFVSSLVSIPVGVSSVHLLLNGLMGIVLGIVAVPAILIALVLQAVFFGYGGLVVLGVNLVNLALPAVVCAIVIRPLIHNATPRQSFWLGFLAGGLGAGMTGALLTGSIMLSDPDLIPAAKIILVTFIPLMVIEGVITGFTVGFLKRVAPELILPRKVRHV
jgi:cobalt/nickel transport system permease protein